MKSTFKKKSLQSAKNTPSVLITFDNSTQTQDTVFNGAPSFDVMLETATEMARLYQKQGIDVIGCIYFGDEVMFFNPRVTDHVSMLAASAGKSDLGVEDRFFEKALNSPLHVLHFTTPRAVLGLKAEQKPAQVSAPIKNLLKDNPRATFDYVVFEDGNIFPQKEAESFVEKLSARFSGNVSVIRLNEEILIYGGSLAARINEHLEKRLVTPTKSKKADLKLKT